MKENVKKLFAEITGNNTEESVHYDVNNAKSEFVCDWEEDFDSLEDAYEEQGRGEAESQVLQDLIREICEDSGDELPTEDRSVLFTELAEHYYLTTS